jgi:hypothetical protein
MIAAHSGRSMPSSRKGLMRDRVLAAAMCLLLGACGGASVQSPTGSVAASISPTPTAFAAATASEPAERLYPYSLQWPADELPAPWRFATTAWDGEARIDHGNAYTDSAEASDGSLFAFGYPTEGGAEGLSDLVAQQAQEWHACNAEPSVEEPLSGGGADGIYAVYACGSSTVLRWVGTHHGFGIFVGLILAPGVDLDQAASRFEERIGQLEWTN